MNGYICTPTITSAAAAAGSAAFLYILKEIFYSHWKASPVNFTLLQRPGSDLIKNLQRKFYATQLFLPF